jgi:hypothetical protein
MIAIENNTEGLREAREQNRNGMWYFIMTHKNGALLPDGAAKIFNETGPYADASSKAQKKARSYGCVDGKDSISLVWFEAIS